jgi:hypothetical protein
VDFIQSLKNNLLKSSDASARGLDFGEIDLLKDGIKYEHESISIPWSFLEGDFSMDDAHGEHELMGANGPLSATVFRVQHIACHCER